MPDESVEHFDVLIAGAGLSGIGAGAHLASKCPEKSFAILEAREAMGGTWDLFRYPGIRSDSDMFTLGYSFRPWKEAKAIADGPAIRQYIHETADEYGLNDKIRYGHRVVRAEWSSEESRWTVQAERTDTGEAVQLTCSFLFPCTGYYDYTDPYLPDFEGTERFRGQIIHPQLWPENLDYDGKRVVVIGSGATAVTIVPAMVDRAEHVTMLQRSPSYIVSLPSEDPIARFAIRFFPKRFAYAFLRWKNALLTQASFHLSLRAPKVMRKLFLRGVERHLPPGLGLDPHFTPRYGPWTQRVCLVPDGDLFDALASGGASIVTDDIETFTETGLKLASGAELEADIIIAATGLNLLVMGGIEIAVDGEDVDLSKTVGYKGMMFSGIPNLAIALGYTNASWTLKCDLTCEYVCRLLNHMDEHGYDYCIPRRPDPSVEIKPFIDLTSGYVLRSIEQFPKQGDRTPWRMHQNYPRDILLVRRGEIEDEGVEFGRTPVADAPERLAA
jgi:cation diffusion facilitator CzcD-associated flavoprotein CzcO